jgi:chromosome segregation ATPase
MRELWTRAVAAAHIDKRGGEAALRRVARSEEVNALREQIQSLRNQLEREALAYGELRAQAARYEAIAKDALSRARDADGRERKALAKLGETQQRVAALEAALQAARRRREAATDRPERSSNLAKPKRPRARAGIKSRRSRSKSP